MAVDLPPDFSVDDSASSVGVPETAESRQAKYAARLNALQVQFDEICQKHDLSGDPVERRQLLTVIAALHRRMRWYHSRIPGAQHAASATNTGRRASSRLSDQIASLDPILSRLP